MGAFNELLKQYGVAVPVEKPEPVPPTKGTTPPTKGTTPPKKGTTPPTRGTTPPTKGTTPPARRTTPPARRTTPPARGKEPSGGSGGMPGVFGKTCTAPKPTPERRSPKEGSRETRRRPVGTGVRLPRLWGVDLALILITLAGIVLLVMNLQVVLLALARAIYWLVRTLFWIALIGGLGVFIVLMIRGRMMRRRGWW